MNSDYDTRAQIIIVHTLEYYTLFLNNKVIEYQYPLMNIKNHRCMHTLYLYFLLPSILPHKIANVISYRNTRYRTSMDKKRGIWRSVLVKSGLSSPKGFNAAAYNQFGVLMTVRSVDAQLLQQIQYIFIIRIV